MFYFLFFCFLCIVRALSTKVNTNVIMQMSWLQPPYLKHHSGSAAFLEPLLNCFVHHAFSMCHCKNQLTEICLHSLQSSVTIITTNKKIITGQTFQSFPLRGVVHVSVLHREQIILFCPCSEWPTQNRDKKRNTDVCLPQCPNQCLSCFEY